MSSELTRDKRLHPGYAGPVASDWTIRRVLEWTAKDFAGRGIDSARLDAEILVAHALCASRVELYMDLDRPLAEAERAAIRGLVQRRRDREPVAYIVGHKEFWGRRFEVGPAVLVPRPDTETLVERALALLPPDASGPVLDLCTGSGIVGLTLAAERPSARVDLSDLSAGALAVAERNADRLGVRARVRFLRGDLFDVIERRYALVTCNPPYLAEGEIAGLEPEVREHEPHAALVAGGDGLAVHRRIVEGAHAALEPGGALLVEVGAGQARVLEAWLADAPWVAATARHRDLGGVERVVEARARG